MAAGRPAFREVSMHDPHHSNATGPAPGFDAAALATALAAATGRAPAPERPDPLLQAASQWAIRPVPGAPGVVEVVPAAPAPVAAAALPELDFDRFGQVAAQLLAASTVGPPAPPADPASGANEAPDRPDVAGAGAPAGTPGEVDLARVGQVAMQLLASPLTPAAPAHTASAPVPGPAGPADVPPGADATPDAAAGLAGRADPAQAGELERFGRLLPGADPRALLGVLAQTGPSAGARPARLESMHSPGATNAASRGGFDVVAVRRDFPILSTTVHGRPLAWLDNAATTQKPQAVIDATARFYAQDNSNIHRGAHTLATRASQAFEEGRAAVRRFLRARRAEEIVFVRGATEGINLVAQTYGRRHVGEGDEIVVTELEHHANIVPWQMLAREKGARLRSVPIDDAGEIRLDAYEALLNSRTRIVALTQASNALGTVPPVAAMVALAHRRGVPVLVDGAQSVPHLPVDVQSIDCDFFVFSAHKLFGPTGIGCLYARHELLESMPPWQGGGGMIADVTFDETRYNKVPERFEAGTPSIAEVVGLRAALDYLERLGLACAAQHEQQLLERLTYGLRRIPGVRLIGTARQKIGVASFVLAGVDNQVVGQAADREGIAVRVGHHCAQPAVRRFGVEGTIRPSLAFYNTEEEVDRFLAVVRGIR